MFWKSGGFFGSAREVELVVALKLIGIGIESSFQNSNQEVI